MVGRAKRKSSKREKKMGKQKNQLSVQVKWSNIAKERICEFKGRPAGITQDVAREVNRKYFLQVGRTVLQMRNWGPEGRLPEVNSVAQTRSSGISNSQP